MRRDDAVAAARPHHRDVSDFRFPAAAALEQHAAERLVGENAGEVVHPAIAFGLADHGDDLVGSELALADTGLKPGGVLHALQFDFRDLNGHSASSSIVLFAVRPNASTAPPRRGASSRSLRRDR
jgi:hypothetical protein